MQRVIKESNVAPFPSAAQRNEKIVSKLFVSDYTAASFACQLQEIKQVPYALQRRHVSTNRCSVTFRRAQRPTLAISWGKTNKDVHTLYIQKQGKTDRLQDTGWTFRTSDSAIAWGATYQMVAVCMAIFRPMTASFATKEIAMYKFNCELQRFLHLLFGT